HRVVRRRRWRDQHPVLVARRNVARRPLIQTRRVHPSTFGNDRFAQLSLFTGHLKIPFVFTPKKPATNFVTPCKKLQRSIGTSIPKMRCTAIAMAIAVFIGTGGAWAVATRGDISAEGLRCVNSRMNGASAASL